MNNTLPLCIYHSNCADGFGAAWVVWKAYRGNVEFLAAAYQMDPPDVTGRDVIMVDFSYKRDVLLKMAEQAESILILDHHKSAAAELVDLPANVAEYFDMDRSGCMMAWDYFFPTHRPPMLLEIIQDRDLWKWQINGTKEVIAALLAYPHDFEVWDDLMESHFPYRLSQEGEILLRKHNKDVQEMIRTGKRRMVIAGHEVPVVNAPFNLASDIGNELAKGELFAVTYCDTKGGRSFSLRSTENGLDVSEIAELFGGGGHAKAAGFRLPFNRLGSDGMPDHSYQTFKPCPVCNSEAIYTNRRDGQVFGECQNSECLAVWPTDAVVDSRGELRSAHDNSLGYLKDQALKVANQAIFDATRSPFRGPILWDSKRTDEIKIDAIFDWLDSQGFYFMNPEQEQLSGEKEQTRKASQQKADRAWEQLTGIAEGELTLNRDTLAIQKKIKGQDNY